MSSKSKDCLQVSYAKGLACVKGKHGELCQSALNRKKNHWNHGWNHYQIHSVRPEINECSEWLKILRNTHNIRVIKILRYNGKLYHICKLYSHCFGFFPCFSPYVNSMTSDQYSARIWVFFHCFCHSFFEILLFWCILNNGNH